MSAQRLTTCRLRFSCETIETVRWVVPVQTVLDVAPGNVIPDVGQAPLLAL